MKLSVQCCSELKRPNLLYHFVPQFTHRASANHRVSAMMHDDDDTAAAAVAFPEDQSCGFCRTDLRPGENGTVVASPNFPDAYPANSSCLWLLQTKVRWYLQYPFEFSSYVLKTQYLRYCNIGRELQVIEWSFLGLLYYFCRIPTIASD